MRNATEASEVLRPHPPLMTVEGIPNFQKIEILADNKNQPGSLPKEVKFPYPITLHSIRMMK